jgi:hypothetical protein
VQNNNSNSWKIRHNDQVTCEKERKKERKKQTNKSNDLQFFYLFLFCSKPSLSVTLDDIFESVGADVMRALLYNILIGNQIIIQSPPNERPLATAVMHTLMVANSFSFSHSFAR